MEKEMKIIVPEGYVVEKIKIVGADVAVVTFKEKERKLPKSWEDFCGMFPKQAGECYIDNMSNIAEYSMQGPRKINDDKNLLPDCATAKAILALSQLIQLRDYFNGDWIPDWNDESYKFMIGFCGGCIEVWKTLDTSSVLYFKTVELRDEFLHNFRPLIEKLKPLYGII